MQIEGKKVILRAIEEKDLGLLQKWANDPVTQEGIGEIHFPSSLDFHQSWFSKLKEDRLNQRFAIEIPEFGIIGTSSLMNIDWRNRHAWHGTVIGEAKHRGHGFGVDTILSTMRYAFEELNLERLDSSIIEYNKVSLATFCGKKIGWKEVGRRKNYFYRKGQFWDQILIGITKQEYLDLIKNTQYWK